MTDGLSARDHDRRICGYLLNSTLECLLIRLEIQAHPNKVGIPISILELNCSGARWLQNDSNCSLAGVGRQHYPCRAAVQVESDKDPKRINTTVNLLASQW
jgi:hypothetical protein